MSRKPGCSGDMWNDAVEVTTCTGQIPIRKLPAVEKSHAPWWRNRAVSEVTRCGGAGAGPAGNRFRRVAW